MAWYSIEMPEESVTDGGYHRFCRQFQKAFIGAGAPPEMALFACREAITDSRRLYLSPSSPVYVPDLIEFYDARPCPVPEAASVTLVYGVPGAKTLLTTTDDADLVLKNGIDSSDERSSSADFPAAQKKREIPTIYPLKSARQAASSG